MKKIVCVLIALMLCLSSTAFADFVPSPTTGDMTRFVTEVENSAADTSGFIVRPLIAENMTEEEYEQYKWRFYVCQFEIDRLMHLIRTYSDAQTGDATLGDAVTVGAADGNSLIGNAMARESADIEGILIAAINAYFGELKDFEGNTIVLPDAILPEEPADPDATEAPAEPGATEEPAEAEIDRLNIFEFMPIIAVGYEDEFGNVTLKMLFSTPYEKDEKVVAMIGLVDAHENIDEVIAETIAERGDEEIDEADVSVQLASDEERAEEIQSVVWTAYEGIGVEIPESLLAAAQSIAAQQTEQQGDAELTAEGDAEVEPEVELGCIQITLEPEMVKAIQEGIALLAIVSL